MSFDTAGLPQTERAAWVTQHLTAASGRCRVTHLCAEAAVWGRWSSLALSTSTQACCYNGSAVRLTRRVVDVSSHPDHRLLFAAPSADGGSLWHAERLIRLDTTALVLVDVGAPYDYRSDGGGYDAVQIEASALPVSAEQVRHAGQQLVASPLHDLALAHVRRLGGLAGTWATDGVSLGDVAEATTRLLAALVLSCTGPPA